MDYIKKYDMTVEENIAYAKRNVVDYIYKSSKLEGLGVTFPDTDAIYNGLVKSDGVISVSDVLTINNLKHAWQFIFETIDIPVDYAYVCKINQTVGDGGLFYEAGFLRKLDVTIGGTKWRPNIPNEFIVKEQLNLLSETIPDVNSALDTTLHLMREQLFFDGNKRTAMLVGNKMMISSGSGILSISPEQIEDFMTFLIGYYETGEAAHIKKYLFDNCIDGTDFTAQREAQIKRNGASIESSPAK